MIIGICGGSGSGKTTLLKRLCTQFESLRPSIFTMDNYYYPIDKQFIDDNGYYNFDLPGALDKERLVEDLRKLSQGRIHFSQRVSFQFTSRQACAAYD